MRTDSMRLSDEAMGEAARFIKSRYGEDYYYGSFHTFKTKSDAQDAHEAIRPSHVELEPERVKQSVTPDQYKLYKLIWSRFHRYRVFRSCIPGKSSEHAVFRIHVCVRGRPGR